jgi:LytS/YehU family sensor histidine kinase
VTVADTGLGFAPAGASTSGTGLGLSNIRERLKLLYGDRAHLVIEANLVDGAPNGTRVSITIPYQSRRTSGVGPV